MFDAAGPEIFKVSEVSQTWSQAKAFTVKFKNVLDPKQPSLEFIYTKKWKHQTRKISSKL